MDIAIRIENIIILINQNRSNVVNWNLQKEIAYILKKILLECTNYTNKKENLHEIGKLVEELFMTKFVE